MWMCLSPANTHGRDQQYEREKRERERRERREREKREREKRSEAGGNEREDMVTYLSLLLFLCSAEEEGIIASTVFFTCVTFFMLP